MTGWLEYFTKGLRNQLMDVKIKGEKVIKIDILEEKIKDFKLNLRQKRALEYLLEHQRIDNSIYQKICNTIKRTASRDLSDLVKFGFLERHGEKKGDSLFL